jgi:flagellar protein FliO/FliZ
MNPLTRALARFSTCAVVCLLSGNGLPALAQPGVQQATYTAEAPDPPNKIGGKPLPAPRPRDPAHSAAKSVPLPPRSATRADGDPAKAARPVKPSSGLATGLASLAVVLGLFFIAAWAVRRALPQTPANLPSEVLEVLGRTPIAGRQFAHLVRCGNKLLLVYLAPGCVETLTEITDAAEVDRLAGICRQVHPQSATASFRNIFQQFSREKPTAEGKI